MGDGRTRRQKAPSFLEASAHNRFCFAIKLQIVHHQGKKNKQKTKPLTGCAEASGACPKMSVSSTHRGGFECFWVGGPAEGLSHLQRSPSTPAGRKLWFCRGLGPRGSLGGRGLRRGQRIECPQQPEGWQEGPETPPVSRSPGRWASSRVTRGPSLPAAGRALALKPLNPRKSRVTGWPTNENI